MTTIVKPEEWAPFDEQTELLCGGGPLTLFSRNMSRAELAEIFVVGSAIKFRSHAEFAVRHLTAQDFSFHPAKLVFVAIAEILKEGRDPMPVAVLDAIQRAKQQHNFIDNNPGLFIYEIIEYVAGGVGMEYNVGLVRDLSAKRKIIELGARMNESADTRESAFQIANRYAREIGTVADRDANSSVVTLAESAINVAKRIDSRHRVGAIQTTGLLSGIAELDQNTGGFQPGHLAILAARPSVGKSALAGLLARNVAQGGDRVLFFSLEMSETELTERMVSMTSGVAMPAIRGHRKLDPIEIEEASRVLQDEFPKLPFAFIDRRGITPEMLANDARAYARSHDGISFIVVDYLQLLKPDNPRDHRHLQIGQATKVLRNLAGELKCPILCLAQLNREMESRGGEPKLSDLRDSGEIEQDADLVMLLHRTSTDAQQPIIDIDLIIAKNRNGPIGSVKLSYVRALTKFGPRLPSF
jgi:replicative DNA helicase